MAEIIWTILKVYGVLAGANFFGIAMVYLTTEELFWEGSTVRQDILFAVCSSFVWPIAWYIIFTNKKD